MGKGGKIVVFIIVAFLILVGVTLIEESPEMAGPFFTIGAVVILVLWRALFKKNKDSEESGDLSLRK